jgi:hypothetical protein
MATTIVYLDCKSLGIKARTFKVDVAQALLQYQARKKITDWELTPKKGYQFKDGIITRTNKGADKEPGEPAADSAGEKP